MLRYTILLAVILSIGVSCRVQAQDAGQKAQALAAALDKNKYKKKENKYVSIEIYIDIKNEPAVKSPAEYSGSYGDGDNGHKLDLKVSPDGAAEGSGYDVVSYDGKSPKMKFTLQNARVGGAVLTATKVFENGTSEQLEAVFVNRTVATGKNANAIESRDTSFGIGFIQTNKEWTNRAFLEKLDQE